MSDSERTKQLRYKELNRKIRLACPTSSESATQYEVDDLETERDKLQARVAQMRHSLTELIQHYSSEAWELPMLKRAEAARDSVSDAWLLRQKADAVDSIAEKMVRDMTVSDIRMVASLLRKSAAEADTAGGGL